MSAHGETVAANRKQEAPRKPKSPGSQVTNGCYFEQERSLQESSLHRFTFPSERGRASGWQLLQPIAMQHWRHSSQHPSMAQQAKHSSQHSAVSE